MPVQKEIIMDQFGEELSQFVCELLKDREKVGIFLAEEMLTKVVLKGQECTVSITHAC